jgi:hypothetical protein
MQIRVNPGFHPCSQLPASIHLIALGRSFSKNQHIPEPANSAARKLRIIRLSGRLFKSQLWLCGHNLPLKLTSSSPLGSSDPPSHA